MAREIIGKDESRFLADVPEAFMQGIMESIGASSCDSLAGFALGISGDYWIL